MSSSPVQPYIICAMNGRETVYFIQGDDWIIIHRPKKCSLLSTFDLLFKIYYTLNLEYPVNLKNFYNFMEVCIYKITQKASGVVNSVHTNILSLIEKNTN